MKRTTLLFFGFLICFSTFSQKEDVKARKLTYDDFISDYSFDDTSTVIIDLFFDRKDNAAYGQMSFLPITIVLALIPQTRLVGMGTTVVSFPLFVNGTYTLFRYRKKKLLDVLVEYKKNKTLPKWVRKKAINSLRYYEQKETEY